MKKVLSLIMALVMMLAVSGCSEAADDGVVTVGVIQFMQHASLDEAYQGFVDGLAEAGYVEGENLKIEFQNASGEVGNCLCLRRYHKSAGSCQLHRKRSGIRF